MVVSFLTLVPVTVAKLIQSPPSLSPPGGAASAGHVPPMPAVVPPRVHPGVQGQLPGPECRLQPQHDGKWLLR